MGDRWPQDACAAKRRAGRWSVLFRNQAAGWLSVERPQHDAWRILLAVPGAVDSSRYWSSGPGMDLPHGPLSVLRQ